MIKLPYGMIGTADSFHFLNKLTKADNSFNEKLQKKIFQNGFCGIS